MSPPASAASRAIAGSVARGSQRLAAAVAGAGGGEPGGERVEELVHPVAAGGRHRPVREAGGEQLDVGPGARQRGAQRAVVRRRVGRRIDDLDAHRQRFSPVRLCYCVVNTNGRDYLLACLDAIRDTAPEGRRARGAGARQRLRRRLGRDRALDAAPGGLGARLRLIALERAGRARPRTTPLLREARGELCLLLNEDSELLPGAAAALVDALDADPVAGRGGRAAARPRRRAAALRLAAARGSGPRSRGRSSCTACWSPRAAAIERARSAGCSRRRWSSAARRWPRSAASTRPSSSTPTRPTSASGFATPAGGSSSSRRRGRSTTSSSRPIAPPASAAWSSSTAAATSTCESTTAGGGRRRRLACLGGRGATRSAALAALALPGHDAAWYALHARAALRPGRGEGLREAAAAYRTGECSLDPVLVAAHGLVDLWGVAGLGLGVGARAAGAPPRGARSARGPPPGGASRAAGARSPALRKPVAYRNSGSASQSAVRESRPAAPSVGSSNSPPATVAAVTATSSASRPHSYGTGNRRWVSAYMSARITA